MEKKKEIKISLATLLLILAIIIIMVMGIITYIFYKDANKKTIELQTQINNLNKSLSEVQEKANDTLESRESSTLTENTTTNFTNNTVSTDNIAFTDEQVRTTIADYLELNAHSNCDQLLECLTEKGKINYNPNKTETLNNGTYITNVKFADYKNAMLDYVTEDEFKRNWSSDNNYNENSDGYLTRLQGGGDLVQYKVNNITKKENLTYTVNATSSIAGESSETENYEFTLKNVNSKCVVDSSNCKFF